jgi:hypothetical protein
VTMRHKEGKKSLFSEMASPQVSLGLGRGTFSLALMSGNK